MKSYLKKTKLIATLRSYQNSEVCMINIGLIGLGNVGEAVYTILQNNASIISERIGQEIAIKSIAVRNLKKYQAKINDTIHLTDDVMAVITDPEIDIIVEVMGGEHPAFDYITTALKNKKSVVTANKEVIAKHKSTFFKLAKENGVDIFFEAAVGGGIPIIRSLKVGFAANKINLLNGILNGTTNYILTKIEEEKQDFSVILKKAQDLGFAEADPTMDVTGLDAAYKLVILAAVAFKVDIQLDDIYYEGIETITLSDISYANQLGFKIKLLATGKRLENNTFSFSVYPTCIPITHPLATVNNEFNATYVVGNYVGESMLLGKGAGGSPTGSAVVSDIIDIGFDSTNKVSYRNLELTFHKANLLPFELTSHQYYVRIIVEDKSGVLEKVSTVFSKEQCSIERIMQNSIEDNKAEIVIVTDKMQEKKFSGIKALLNDIDELIDIVSTIRVSK